MSDYFTKQNKAEFGPPPVGNIWMVVDQSEGTTKVAVVTAHTAFLARQEAAKLIHNLSNSAVLYPNVVMYDRS